MKSNILVTGAAGFIWFSLCKYLLKKGIKVVGLDNFNSYYDPRLKKSRIDLLLDISKQKGVSFEIAKVDLQNSSELN